MSRDDRHTEQTEQTGHWTMLISERERWERWIIDEATEGKGGKNDNRRPIDGVSNARLGSLASPMSTLIKQTLLSPFYTILFSINTITAVGDLFQHKLESIFFLGSRRLITSQVGWLVSQSVSSPFVYQLPLFRPQSVWEVRSREWVEKRGRERKTKEDSLWESKHITW